jgi:hypothetical protein
VQKGFIQGRAKNADEFTTGHTLKLELADHSSTCTNGNFLLLRPYHGEHGPKVPVTQEYIVLQRVLRKRECLSILTKMSIHTNGGTRM